MSNNHRNARSASSANISLQIDVDGISTTEECETLVIACDPRNLENANSKIINYSEKERALFARLGNYTFHTTLLKVKVLDRDAKHGVIFAPEPLSEMDCSVYGFRNETAKSLGLDFANYVENNWVTVYQICGEREMPPTAAEFARVLREEIQTLEWWPFDRTDVEFHETVTTPYFDHFDGTDLVGHDPWRWFALQGNNNTVFVHASTCFESVVHCWYYINRLFDAPPNGKPVFGDPSDRIVILGAGVSGILVANELRKRGYTNVKLFENTNRYGGKTHTVKKDQFGYFQKAHQIYCELGTCYLSPHYKAFIEATKEYQVGNKPIGFGGEGGTFRGIVTKGQFSEGFRTKYHVKPMEAFPDYVLMKAAQYLGENPKYKTALKYEIEAAAAIYETKYVWYFGWPDYPMPKKPPKEFLEEYGTKSFGAYLDDNHMGILKGIMQYAYSVQGYGPVEEIPAYYGLIWITPDILLAALEGGANTTLITAWSRGWGDLWDQMTVGMDITLNAVTKSIDRKLQS